MRALAVAIPIALASCASARDCTPEAVRLRSAREAVALRASLHQLASSSGEAHVLVLSGGGSHGAFGAGVLRGWRAAAPARPEFSVVTGVSTGALLATHAFLGRPEDDDRLERLYTTVTDGDVFSKRFFLLLPFSNSIASLAPLERLIAREVDDATIDRVAEAGAAGRRLFVATTNLDEGRVRVWDLTDIARRGEYALYRAVLLASAAVPGLYPPVVIDNAMHSDGGVREQLFVRRVMIELGRLRRARRGPTSAPGVTVHVLMNGQLDPAPTCVDDGLLPIALRGVAVLASAAAVGNLHQSRATATASGAEWRLARIPAWTDVPFDSQRFDPEGMRALYRVGVDFGRAGEWEAAVPEVLDALRGE